MAETVAMSAAPRRLRMHPAWLVAVLMACAFALALRHFADLLPANLWWRAFVDPDMRDLRQIVVHESVVPRIAVCLLGGAQLALAGAIFQQVLRNPLAEPTTLGVSAGASLALTVATLFAPQWLFGGQQWVALTGAVASVLLVLALSWRRRLAPVALILAGLIVTFYCGSLGAVLTLFHRETLQSLFMWSAGSLAQNNWDAPRTLLPHLAIGAVLAAALVRPLTMMSLSDAGAQSLGVSLRFVRVSALALAVFLSASVVASVGVIGFLGMLAPLVVRLAGARRFRSRLVWAPLFGAALLWVTDELVQMIPGGRTGLPTGAVMSLLGAPFVFWLLPRLPALPDTVDLSADATGFRRVHLPRWIALGVVLLAASVVLGLSLGGSTHGWTWARGANFDALLPWRAPRVAVALSAGAMLALAGAILQRVTGNSMASPEVLGISAGASLGVIALAFVAPEAGRLLQTGAAGAGAFGALVVMLAAGRRYHFAPERMLLLGVALGTAFSALVSVLLATDDPRLTNLLAWLSGSTFGVTAHDAMFACAALVVLMAAALFFARWLDILPLGDTVSRSLGVGLGASRIALMLLAAVLTGAATMVVGPLSFVGLMAPHLARMLGFRRAAAQLASAAILGALVMVVADWLGRNMLFPYQVPVGLQATLVGGLYFMWLMLRGRTAP
ncbi:iron-hydroxamate transporter permease subunit [Caballeronia novacaledonica]|uniref:Iron-hydroxamate transporter permease subunit n=1 Tax=Caballeronia novacaledonica TaxID=1544861 RepID=A0A2U3IDI8_9BURK|nr:Fe(3+)-hydroxamate ABC transporter permease FhuB [Caballeronia novacaledonica]SPB18269.1 iron-hydroxamate transporter permease subunit [Caballeronia novacaledonica]